MIDIKKLKYDLALQSAAIMTWKNFMKGGQGNPADLMMINFLNAYRQYSEVERDKKLRDIVEEIKKSK